ncbi:proline-rich transmembrane protein 1-like [Tubulanus polymorphus]|uniref:proline-rich transmembrane protein 1-like n=1 Tax=Tubulanus polymorphus TaxID=672921 RepID=UPI003DA670B9
METPAPRYNYGPNRPLTSAANQTPNRPPQSQSDYGYDQPRKAPTVITVREPARVIERDRVPDFTVFAICTMICCCLPVGIIALIKAMTAKVYADNGDIRAKMMSREARNWSIVALVSGICCHAIWILLLVFYLTGVWWHQPHTIHMSTHITQSNR